MLAPMKQPMKVALIVAWIVVATVGTYMLSHQYCEMRRGWALERMSKADFAERRRIINRGDTAACR